MKNNLPVKAKLITRNGFTKIVYMDKLCNHYRMPLIPKVNLSAKISINQYLHSSEILDFYLKSYKENKMLKYIYAVFEEI